MSFTLEDWNIISEWFQSSLLTVSELGPAQAKELKLKWLKTAEKVQSEKQRLMKIRASKADKGQIDGGVT